MLKRKLALSLVFFMSIFFIFAKGNSLSNDQEKRLVSNLNYIQYSICKLKNTQNKAIAEDEYYKVINQLDLSSINNNDLINAYTNFLNLCTTLKLKQNEKDFLIQLNSQKINNIWNNAFSSFGSIFVPGRTWQETAISIAYTAVANFMNVQNEKNNINNQLESDLFYLDQDNLQNIYNAQTNLFTTCMNLLGGKNLNGRILEDTFKSFIQISLNDDSNEVVVLLSNSNVQENLKDFPPYWYILGKNYQLIGDFENALKCYDNFERLKKNDVILKDYNYVNVLKNKISIYLDIGKSNYFVEKNVKRNKIEILNCISLLYKNTLDSDIGELKAYLAKIYFLIGETKKAEECINYIIKTSSINKAYVNDVITLRSLIKASNNDLDNIFYRSLMQSEDIKFFTYKVDTNREKPKFGKGYFLNSLDYLLTPDYYEYLGFELPQTLLGNRDVHISVDFNQDDEQELDITSELRDGYNIFYTNLDMKELYGRTKNLIINFIDKNNTVSTLNYLISNISNNCYDRAEVAFNMIGSDISACNASVVLMFGEILQKRNYKYQIKDVAKRTKEIRKQKLKEGFLSDKQLEKEINRELALEFQIDIDNLISVLNNVYKEYYDQYRVLYKPNIISGVEDKFIIGLLSLYKDSFNNTVYVNSLGDVKLRYTGEKNPNYINSLKKKVESNDYSSCVELFTCYYDGNYVEQDYAECSKLLKKLIEIEDTSLYDDVSFFVMSPYFNDFFVNPDISYEEKTSLIDEIINGDR